MPASRIPRGRGRRAPISPLRMNLIGLGTGCRRCASGHSRASRPTGARESVPRMSMETHTVRKVARTHQEYEDAMKSRH